PRRSSTTSSCSRAPSSTSSKLTWTPVGGSPAPARRRRAAAGSREGGPFGTTFVTMATLLEQVRDAMNAHDAELLASLIAEDYRSAQPLHPSRAFSGRDQLHENWIGVFKGVPDFSATLVASSVTGDVEWGE